jgi:hypothetical protein
MPCPYPKIINFSRSDFTIARLIVGKRHCRVLTFGNMNSDATGFVMNIHDASRCDRIFAVPASPPGVENPRLIAKVLSRGLMKYTIFKMLDK